MNCVCEKGCKSNLTFSEKEKNWVFLSFTVNLLMKKVKHYWLKHWLLNVYKIINVSETYFLFILMTYYYLHSTFKSIDWFSLPHEIVSKRISHILFIY